jgi:hypothetical protein
MPTDRHPPKPTTEQCSQNARLPDFWNKPTYAFVYPQMGGYWGPAVVVLERDCFDVFVWHDGEFPFDEDHGSSPACIHHCMAQQFVDFGEKVLALQEALP